MNDLDLTVYGTRHSGRLISRRRPHTSYSARNFSPSPRIRSAQYKPEAVVMPRSHISVARFYDWSEDLDDCVSVSKFYRELAFSSKMGSEKLKNKQWCSNGVHINPGRMFLRDKAGLTKGEREIIEGIYRNRGDGSNPNSNNNSNSLSRSADEWQVVRSHKDAWLVGKFHNNSKNLPRSNESLDSYRTPESFRMLETPFNKAVDSRREICASFIESLPTPAVPQSQVGNFESTGRQEAVLIAPPSTPDREQSSSETSDSLSTSHTLSSKHSTGSQATKRRIFKCGEGSVVVDANRKSCMSKTSQKDNKDFVFVNHDSVKNGGVQLNEDKKKVFVNVFLPQTSQEISRENTSVTPDSNISAMDMATQRTKILQKKEKLDNTTKALKSPRDLPSVRFTKSTANGDSKRSSILLPNVFGE